MQFSKIFSLAACLAFVHALPAPESRSAAVKVIFKGAAGAQYELTVPLDGRTVDTNNRLSVSSISSTFDIAKFCTLKTVDFPPALVEGPSGTWQVGPPQTVNSIACKAGVLSPSSIPTVNIQFNGAADAKYFLTVPLDNTVIPTHNRLSISTITTSYPNLPSCNIKYVDFPAALSKIGTDTWAVGPPQSVISIQCPPFHPVV